MTDPEPVYYRARKIAAVFVILMNGLFLMGILNMGAVLWSSVDSAAIAAMCVFVLIAALPVSGIVLAVGGLGRSAKEAGVISLIAQVSIVLLAIGLRDVRSHEVQRTGGMLAMPCCGLIAFAFNILGAVLTLTFEHYALAEYPCCQHCGYNLTANVSGICPECGKSI